jgi:hypothetical protein
MQVAMQPTKQTEMSETTAPVTEHSFKEVVFIEILRNQEPVKLKDG